MSKTNKNNFKTSGKNVDKPGSRKIDSLSNTGFKQKNSKLKNTDKKPKKNTKQKAIKNSAKKEKLPSGKKANSNNKKWFDRFKK